MAFAGGISVLVQHPDGSIEPKMGWAVLDSGKSPVPLHSIAGAGGPLRKPLRNPFAQTIAQTGPTPEQACPLKPAGLPFVAQLARAELSTEISRLKVEAVRLHKSHSQQEGMALLKAAKRLELRLAALDFGLEERWLLDFASLERERVELTVLANVEAALRRVKRNSAADKVAALRQARQLEDREDADQVGTLARTLSWELEQLERELEPQCANTLDSCDT